MKKAKISELKNNLSAFLHYVHRGGTVRVFDRSTPVADIVPIGTHRSAGHEKIEAVIHELERQGAVRRGSGKLPRGFLKRTLPEPRSSVLAALLDERREGR